MRYFTFNQQDSRAFGYVTRIERSLLPPLDVHAIPIPLKAGAYVPTTGFRDIGIREFKVGFAMLGNSPSDLRAKSRTFANILFDANITGKPAPLIFSDESNRFYNAYLTGATDIDEVAAIGEVEFTFIAADPYAYATSSRTLYFTSGKLTVTNDGTAGIYPRFRIVPTTPSFSAITIDRGDGQKVSFSGFTINSGQALIIDNATNEVYLEATKQNLLPYVDITSSFFSLASGETYTLTNSNSAITSARMDITERYI